MMKSSGGDMIIIILMDTIGSGGMIPAKNLITIKIAGQPEILLPPTSALLQSEVAIINNHCRY